MAAAPTARFGIGHCAVCGCGLQAADAPMAHDRVLPTCRSSDCRSVANQRSVMNPAQFELHLAGQRSLIRSRREAQAARQRRIDAIERHEAEQDQALAQALLQREPTLTGRLEATLRIPSGIGPVLPLPAERIERYRAHLEASIHGAAEHADASSVERDHDVDAHDELLAVEARFAERPGLRRVCDRICGLCQGGCCAKGGDQAYLSVITMRRLMDADPERSGAELLADYLARIPEASVAGGCINQTATGCALPRELRSDICNRYYCEPLKAWQEQPASGAGPVLVIRRAETLWNRFEAPGGQPVLAAAVVDAETVRTLDLPALLEQEAVQAPAAPGPASAVE